MTPIGDHKITLQSFTLQFHFFGFHGFHGFHSHLLTSRLVFNTVVLRLWFLNKKKNWGFFVYHLFCYLDVKIKKLRHFLTARYISQVILITMLVFRQLANNTLFWYIMLYIIIYIIYYISYITGWFDWKLSKVNCSGSECGHFWPHVVKTKMCLTIGSFI